MRIQWFFLLGLLVFNFISADYAFALYAKGEEETNPGLCCFVNFNVAQNTRVISFSSAIISFTHGFNEIPACEFEETGSIFKTITLSNARLIRYRKDAQPGIGQTPIEDKSFSLGTCSAFSELLTNTQFSTPVGAFSGWPADIYQNAQDNEPSNYLFVIEFKCRVSHSCAGTLNQHCMCDPGVHWIESLFRIQYLHGANANRSVSFSLSPSTTSIPALDKVELSVTANINTDILAWINPYINNLLDNCNLSELTHSHTITYNYAIDWKTPGEAVEFGQLDEHLWSSYMYIEDVFGSASTNIERMSSVSTSAQWVDYGQGFIKTFLIDFIWSEQ